jgi:hypothetical protein
MVSTDEKKTQYLYQDASGMKKVTERKDVIYLLKLHETAMIGNNTVVLRVPMGWIYTQTLSEGPHRNTSASITSVFVPYSNEFSEHKS